MSEEHRQADGPTRSQVAEYLLIAALIVLIAIVALVLFSVQLGDILALIAEEIHPD